MLNSRRFILCLSLLALVAVRAAGAAADDAAARIATLRGDAYALDVSGHTRELDENSPLRAGDRVVTAKRARAFLRFTDDTLVVLGPQTVFRIDGYRYDPTSAAADSGEMSFSIFKGLARAVTGALAKRQPKRVKFWTTVATIGIRGTHFAAEVGDTSAKVVLLEAETAGAPNAIEVANEFGRVEIDRAGYGTEIPDAHSPPSPPRRLEINNMQRMLRSLQTNRRVLAPRMPGR